MKQIRDIRLSSASDAVNAWIFWADALERSDADKLVKDGTQATTALLRINQRDFQKEQMQDWLLEWPTSFGLEEYTRVAG